MASPPQSTHHPASAPRPGSRTFGFVGLLTAAVLTLSSCAGAASGQGSVNDLKDQALPDEVPAGTVLNIADQQEQQQVGLKSSGELDDFSFDYEFSNFVGGPEILEAFRAGAVDVARVGDTPPIQAFASG